MPEASHWPTALLGDLFALAKQVVSPASSPHRVFLHHSLPSYDEVGGPRAQPGEEIQSHKFVIDRPCVLVSKLNPRISRVELVEDPVGGEVASTEYMVLFPKEGYERRIHLPFYARMFAGRAFQARLVSVATGTTGSHTRARPREILGWPVAFPPLSEQRRAAEIVHALSVQERAIEASIAKLRDMKAGALDQLLDEFDWDRTLVDAADGAIRNGFSPVESKGWTGVQMLGLGCLTPAGFEPIQLKNAPSTVAAGHVAMLQDGDLLMSRANTRELVGLAGVYRDVGSPCIYPDLMMRIRSSRYCSVDFLAAVLMSPRARRYIRSMAQGTSESMVKVSAGTVRGIPVPLPSLEEQARVLAALSSLSRQIDSETGELAKLRTLKLGLVDDLLAAKI